MSDTAFFVAVGGFRLKSPLLAPVFFALAAPALRRAQRAPGCVWAGARPAMGRQFSLSVWDSPAMMRAYASAGPHLRAMRAAAWLGEGPFAHFTTHELPGWDAALMRWCDQCGQALSPAAPPR